MAKTKPKVTIKFYEVLNWLFSNQEELPETFRHNKTQLDKIVPYLTEQFWAMPDLVSYLNKHLNDLYKIPDSKETLKLLKKIVKTRKLTKRSCWVFIPTREKNLIKEIKERDLLDSGNARAKIMLIKKLNLDSVSGSYFKVAPTKKNSTALGLKDTKTKTIVKEALLNDIKIKERVKNVEQSNDSRFLKKLDQSVIDSLELILFDVSLLKKTNRVLFTFIDKNNAKKYFLTPFRADIYLSTKNGVVNNDYIEDKNEDFKHYIINDIKLYSKLKFTLNASYKRILNGN